MKFKTILLIFLSLTVITVSAKKQNDLQDGDHHLYRKDGTLLEKASYKNGLLDGLRYEYFDDGKTIKKITNYKDGKKSGMEKFYDKLGILRDFKEH